MRVLVVDDEIRNAELTALDLRDAGHDADFVGSGEDALRRMEAASFDAVITDLRMKPPDGLALLGAPAKGFTALERCGRENIVLECLHVPQVRLVTRPGELPIGQSQLGERNFEERILGTRICAESEDHDRQRVEGQSHREPP